MTSRSTSQEPGRLDSHARAATSPSAWAVLLAVFLVGMSADLVSKSVAFKHVAGEPILLDRSEIINNPDFQILWHRPIHAIPGRLLDFNLVINRGAVFGLGENRRGAFIAFTMFAAAAGLFVFTRWTHRGDRLAHVALGLILAGGIGNLYDRIAFGVVRDFLHIFPGRRLPFGWSWPGGNPELFPWVFNVADVLLLTGMGLLMIHLNRSERTRRSAAAANSAPVQASPASSSTAPSPPAETPPVA
jgi:signal peptidase II